MASLNDLPEPIAEKTMDSLNDLPEPIAEKTMASLNDLPEPIAESLLLFLDGDDLIRCGAVCSEWYQKINDMDNLWKRICLLEGISAEEYDWDLTDEWDLFRKPCYWKRIYLNFMKLAYNFRKDIYCSIAIPPALSFFDIAAYNGETFVTTDRSHINILKVKDKTVEYKQTIFCQGFKTNIVTNTAYIVVDSQLLLWIYKLTANRYELDSILYFNSDHGIVCSTNIIDIPNSRVEVDSCIVGILNNTLYLKSDATLLAWDMDRKIWLLHAACDDVVHDAHSVYVYFSNTITVYDADCNIKYALNIVESVKGMFLVCNKLIAICEVKRTIDITVVYIWYKKTGVLIQRKIYPMPSGEIGNVVNHKRSLIMLRLVGGKVLLAYDLEKNIYLWDIKLIKAAEHKIGIGIIPKGIKVYVNNLEYEFYTFTDGTKLTIPEFLKLSNNLIVENNQFKLYR